MEKAGKISKIKFSETIVIRRSEVMFSPYNPKKHSKEDIQRQLRNFEKVGFLGGIVWNETTGNLVSGHKRVMALDINHKYDGSPETDYDIKVERVHLDERTEKEQNIYMDARATNTRQDYDLLAELIPDIDYKNAGLTDEDLQLIGIDFSMQTDAEKDMESDLEELYQPVREEKEASREQKRQDIKAKKEASNEKIGTEADNLNSYVVINFDSYREKLAFMLRFGFDPLEKFIVGNLFSDMIERVE